MGTVEARASRGPHAFSRIALGLALVALFVACTKDHEPPPEPAGPRGASLVIDPLRAHAGDSVTIRVESDVVPTLGLDSKLDRWTGSAWKFEFILVKAWQNGSADYAPVGEFISFVSVGLQGHQSWPITIPNEAEPGRYRIREQVVLESEVPATVVLSVQFDVAA
jgi:hypothetical protein